MGESATSGQSATPLMAYPTRGTFNRLLFKSPLICWRMGLGRILGPSLLVLSTWGRKSHQSRHTMLSYTPKDGRIYLGAGWGSHCDWYQNLELDPHVTLQVCSGAVTGVKGEAILPAIARRVTDEQEFRSISKRLFEAGGDLYFKPWLKSLGIDYDPEDLVAKRDRIHQIALDLQPVAVGNKTLEAAYPPPMEIDLMWVWAIIAGSFGLGWLIGRRGK